MMGVGIIGLGMAVKPHALALRDLEAAGRVRVLDGFAPSGGRRAGFAAATGWPVFDRIEALPATPGLGLVIVLTPPRAAAGTAPPPPGSTKPPRPASARRAPC